MKNQPRKNIGKIVAVAMASAMAMSSLSAAFATVSAIEEPALLDNGSIALRKDAMGGEVSLSPIFPIAKSTTLNLLIPEGQDSILLSDPIDTDKLVDLLQYTDSEGRAMDVHIDKVSWSTVSGGSFVSIHRDGSELNVKKTDGKNPGRAVIRMKADATVDLGGSKGKIKSSYTKEFKVNVYKEGDIYLEAYSGTSKQAPGDLTGLAAYGDTLTFRAVTFEQKDAKSPGYLGSEKEVTMDGSTITEAHFYAGDSAKLFDGPDGKALEKGSKAEGKGHAIGSGDNIELELKTNGTVGIGTVKLAITKDKKTIEYVLDVQTAKTIKVKKDFLSSPSVTIKKKGSKTILAEADPDKFYGITENTNLSGFALKVNDNLPVTVEGGILGNLTANSTTTSVEVTGGKTGNISAKKADVHISGDATVGNITGSASAVVEEDGVAGKITSYPNQGSSGMVEVRQGGEAAGIDAEEAVVSGGTVTGDVKARLSIEVRNGEPDDDDNWYDTRIQGNVIAKSLFSNGKNSGDSNFAATTPVRIVVENESENGAANVSILGNVIAKFSKDVEEPTIQLGSGTTSGHIYIGGSVQGESLQIGGNGLVTCHGVKPTDEKEYDEEEEVLATSSVAFQNYNSAVDSLDGFQNVKVKEGTLLVYKPLQKVERLSIEENSQLVAKAGVSTQDWEGSGQLVTEAGKLQVTGTVSDQPTLFFTGSVTEGSSLYLSAKNSKNAFTIPGITTQGQKTADGHVFSVKAANSTGLYAQGKDVSLGIGQEKSITAAWNLESTVLPEGARMLWTSSDPSAIAVEGDGTTATIKGIRSADQVEVTAKVVDAAGKSLSYNPAKFFITVTEKGAVDVKLDAVAVTLAVDGKYGLLVKENSDVENIHIAVAKPEIVKVELVTATDPRGSIYHITGLKEGETVIYVAYQGATSSLKVKVEVPKKENTEALPA